MKKIVLMIIAAVTLNLALSTVSFAEDIFPEGGKISPELEDALKDSSRKFDEDDLSEATFDVRDILTLPGNEQPAKYYNKEEGPLVGFILEIMNFATAIIGSIALILFIVAGFTMMLSEGNQQRVDKAKDIFKYAIIGLVVAFLSYIIVLFMQSVFITKASQT